MFLRCALLCATTVDQVLKCLLKSFTMVRRSRGAGSHITRITWYLILAWEASHSSRAMEAFLHLCS